MEYRCAETRGYRFILEPGDATRYDFEIQSCARLKSVVAGIGEHPNDYFVLIVHGPGTPGVCVMHRQQLADPRRYHVYDAKGHGMHTEEYTVAALLLAAGWLLPVVEGEVGTEAEVESCMQLACEAIMGVPSLLYPESVARS